MTLLHIGKKFLKFTIITLAILLALVTGFHFWFKAHAKGIIEDMVESRSNGKLKLKIGRLHFSYFSKKIEMERAVFYSTDTANGATAYKFSVDKIKIQAKAILPIVFQKRLLIDSLTLLNPHIEVTRLREIEKPDKKQTKDVSIPEEMGKVYRSIQDALQALEVKRFQIDNGTFTLINKITPGQLPITISNLHFHIDNLQVSGDTLTGKENILFSENIVLKSHNQNILFPDGRHRLSFGQFSINLQNKLVEFDSCTIAATRGDSADASFNVFFDALKLTNIDFDTLYKAEVIKADSVYCINPKFNLNVQIGKKKDKNKPTPKLSDIIKQLTGDLQLAHVIVENADFNIKTIKDGNPSSFTFSNNNFEMQGLSIDQEAAKPLKVQSFAMAIRNYENFLKDSAYSIKFDSILFKDDHITLSNFLFNKLDNGKVSNSFSIPQFTLQGLSWDDLVFEKKLKAEQAIMFNPHIIYTAGKQQNKNIFQSLGAVNEYMDLKYLDIINGDIDLRLKNNLVVQLENADVAVESNSLLTSTKMAGIKNSLTNLNFKNGKIKVGNLILELNDIRYAGKSGQFSAGSMNIKSIDKKTNVSLQDVEVKKMLVNEISGSVFADGINWKKADISIMAGDDKKNIHSTATIDLKNVRGANTSFNAIINGKSISTRLKDIYFDQLVKKPDSKIQLDGLAVTGEKLEVKDNHLNLTVAAYKINDNQSSSFNQIAYKSNNGKTEATAIIPSMTTIPHIQPLLNGDVAIDAVNIIKPVIEIQVVSTKKSENANKSILPKIDISEIKLQQPTINFKQQSDSGTLTLDWLGKNNNSNFLQATNLHTTNNNTTVGNLNFFLTDFIFSSPRGKKFNTGDGKISAQLNTISLEQSADAPLKWTATVSGLDASDFRLDSIGKLKSNLVLKTGTLNNLHISSSTLPHLQQLAAINGAVQIKQVTGSYSNANTNLNWYNAAFNLSANVFSVDSFSMLPSMERDSFLAHQTFQTDYITLKSGAINLGPVDIANYIKNNELNVGTATINNLHFTDYRDKQLPFNAGIIKPLTVNLLKKVPQKLAVKSLLVNNAYVKYTETNEKTKAAGTIPITRMNLHITNAKNYAVVATDSLSIVATGYLMDTTFINLRVKESYTDPLGGFLMTVRISPTDLRVLNPAIVPLASAKIVSGYLDTLTMRAIGREYLAMGEMNMQYHDLKIRIFKNGDSTRKSFLTGFANLLIKNKNTTRMGQVFVIRKRDRSAINYLIKIAMSGIASSVGVKSNKKMIRKYKNELDKKKLPPIDLE